MRQIFLFLYTFFFFSLILVFPVYFLYLFLFLLSFLLLFLFLTLILIFAFLLLYYSLPTSFPPHQKTIEKRLKTKHLEDECKQHQRPFISFLLDAALVGERTTGMEVAALQHDGGVIEDEVDGALSYNRTE